MENTMKDFSLHNEDEGLAMEGLVDQSQVAKVELSLAGNFLKTKTFNFSLMRNRIADIDLETKRRNLDQRSGRLCVHLLVLSST